MESPFSFFKIAFFGFFGLLLVLTLVALLFGKRIRKRREYEAEFHDMSGREFGEFGFEMSKVDRDAPGFAFKANFRMRHESLEKGEIVQVYVDDLLVMQGPVTKAGEILLRERVVVSESRDPEPGQVCRVVWGGIEQFRAPIRRD